MTYRSFLQLLADSMEGLATITASIKSQEKRGSDTGSEKLTDKRSEYSVRSINTHTVDQWQPAKYMLSLLKHFLQGFVLPEYFLERLFQ